MYSEPGLRKSQGDGGWEKLLDEYINKPYNDKNLVAVVDRLAYAREEVPVF